MATIIIVGAARSGTKLLRDLLASSRDCTAVPYDINYVWRLGNESVPHDAFRREHVRRAKKQKIRNYLDKQRAGKANLLEKTVASGLRVPFVYEVLPEARFVFVIRNPYDVVESVMRQWNASPDVRYTLEKARHFPWNSAPRYASKYAIDLINRSRGKPKRTVWGPRYPGVHEDLKELPLEEVCARQWAESVSRAVRGFDLIGVRPCALNYEDLCRDPGRVGRDVGTTLRLEGPSSQATETVGEDRIGRGERRLSGRSRDQIGAIVDPVYELAQDFVRRVGPNH